MAWLDKYRDAIEQAAWETGTPLITADSRTIDGFEEIPMLYILAPNKASCKELQTEFETSLEKSLGEDQPFMVYAAPPNLVKSLTKVYSIGEWKL